MSDVDRDKTHLFPPFAELLNRFEAELARASLPFYLFEGMRSFERQAELYAIGRTKPGKVVTNAEPGRSYHFYGIAADYVLDSMTDKPGIQWSWEMRGYEPAWSKMADLAQRMGMEAAYYWQQFPECPHVQCRYGLTIPRAYELWRTGGMPAVWAEADAWIKNQIWPRG
jgi:peptidoglycan LD-endopeptidase CwlK